MFNEYKLKLITPNFLDAIDNCNNPLELAKLALRIIVETPADEFTATFDPEKIAALTNVMELKKLIGELLLHREHKKIETWLV
jgi:hypothetical protein